MTPDQKFKSQVWQILKWIKEESLARGSGELLVYDMPNLEGVGIIPKVSRRDIFKRLHEWGVIRPYSSNTSTSMNEIGILNSEWSSLVFLPLQPAFDESYALYENELLGIIGMPVNNNHTSNNVLWSVNFRHEQKGFHFEEHGYIRFSSNTRLNLFRELFNGNGNWVPLDRLTRVTNKDANYVRSTISQIEKSMSGKLKMHISIPSTKSDDLIPKPLNGAYRIRYLP